MTTGLRSGREMVKGSIIRLAPPKLASLFIRPELVTYDCVSSKSVDVHQRQMASETSKIYSVRIQLENLPERCDFSKCVQPDPNKINVHLIPHTHDDVGWLKTVDQYYYGSKNYIQNAGVQYILDTVVEELIMNKDRRFIYVETAFFWKWWLEQDYQMQSVVKELVQSGQLEFINGGWSMPDEATTHYNSLIDQSTWGLRRLNDTFGRCGRPRVTWQIDPFGHSREMANLYAQMGYDALYFAREDYQDRSFRQVLKTLELVWQGSSDLGQMSDLFTGMMQMGYGPPKGLNWDLIGGLDEPVIDNPKSEEYNIPLILKKFVNLVQNYSYYYATNNIMFPMGTDFNYQSAHSWFKNMDKLIKIIDQEENLGIKVFYSTPSCYTKALWDYGLKWTGKNDDYFPYASDPHAYWTGYFTSRPALKRMERVGNNWLQACKQLDVFAGNNGRFETNITILREAMGVMQHHDAVSGTEKQHVANDYAKLLYNGIKQCQLVITASYAKLAKNQGKHIPQPVFFCDYLNISSCDITESGQSVAVTLYNPLAHKLINHVVRLPINDMFYYQVYDTNGQLIPSVVVPIPDSVRKIPGRINRNSSELVFRVNIEALGLVTYSVLSSLTPIAHSAELITETKIKQKTKLKGRNFELIFGDQGKIIQINLLKQNETVLFRNNFRYYKAAAGDNILKINRSSGAYIFRPHYQETFSVGRLIESKLYKDKKYNLVQEVHQKFDSFVEQVIRVDPYHDSIEFEFLVGPISIKDNIGKEIVIQYETNLMNEGVFYTDANGRQMMRRQWNYRPTWPFTVEEPISGNYYPVNSRIAILDQKRNLQLSILNDRSQGGTSPNNGTIELMVHRRLLHDDAFGVDEALNETGIDGRGLVIRGRHLLLLDSIENSAGKHRPLAQQLFMQPIISFSKIEKGLFDSENFLIKYSNLDSKLPPNVHLLTLEQWSGDSYLLRLEHFYQRKEDKNLSQPVTINLRNLFTPFNIIQVQEMTLGANQDVNIIKNRLKFNYTRISDDLYEPLESKFDSETFDIDLHPMQIRTFIIKVKRKFYI